MTLKSWLNSVNEFWMTPFVEHDVLTNAFDIQQVTFITLKCQLCRLPRLIFPCSLESSL